MDANATPRNTEHHNTSSSSSQVGGDNTGQVAGTAPTADHPFPEAPGSRLSVASQRQLIWWKFRKHKPALVSAVIVIFIYLVAIFAPFLAPFGADEFDARYTYAPPQPLHFFHERRFVGPFVYGLTQTVEQEAMRRVFTVDPEQRILMGFFVQGVSYNFLEIIQGDRHFFGPIDPKQKVYLLGGDHLGRDVLSRIIYGTRISMSIGLVGVFLSLVIGIILGGISGYYGGKIDELIQRTIEIIRSIPTIPLWMGLAAAIPKSWSSIQIYFAITVILSLIGWTGLARVVRGRFLSLREEDFVMAARLDGLSETRIILRHMVPAFISHIIASLTLSIPGVILAETSLSFLGLGIQPPAVSWGVLLNEAQNVRAVAAAPWLLIPAGVVVFVVLVLNFLGDGLRDAADPYN
ncbi:MAG: ABC transporter permease [Chloroflexales bacterium]|nr:ABC transporter permease [Chloroflexales bacterium]